MSNDNADAAPFSLHTSRVFLRHTNLKRNLDKELVCTDYFGMRFDPLDEEAVRIFGSEAISDECAGLGLRH